MSAERRASNYSFGSIRVLTQIVVIAAHDTAKILGPRPVPGTAEQDVADAAGAQLLHLGRVGEKGIDFALGELLQRIAPGHPADVARRIETNCGT